MPILYDTSYIVTIVSECIKLKVTLRQSVLTYLLGKCNKVLIAICEKFVNPVYHDNFPTNLPCDC